MKILFAESEFWKNNQKFLDEYKDVITNTYEKAKIKLSNIPENVTFVCQTNEWECVPETGEGGFTKSSRLILLSIDPELPYGEERLLEHTESTLFHELHHSARYESGIWHKNLLENCIMEGLATVFEYKMTNKKPLWANYDNSIIKSWYREISLIEGSVSYNQYMYTHQDGRRWIGYKVGTWIVENAINNSGKTVEELTNSENNEILKLANL